MLYSHKEWTNDLFFSQKYKRIYFPRKESKLLWSKRDWLRQTETEWDEYMLPYWPLTLSSLDHTTLCYLPGLTSSLPWRDVRLRTNGPIVRCDLYLPTAKLDWLLQDCPYLMWASTFIISQRPHISAQLRDSFHSFTHVRPV